MGKLDTSRAGRNRLVTLPPEPSSAEPSGSVGQEAKIVVRDFNFFYRRDRALQRINLSISDKCVTALLGPSGCGKSTLLRVFNRIYDLYPEQRCTGEVMIDGRNILDPSVDVQLLRARVGMVFQKPTPFPMSIYDNVAFGIRLYERLSKDVLDSGVEQTLRRVALWEEAKDILHQSGLSLSGGQQQRLCIGRAIAINPEVILLDEPCSALDPISTSHVEQLIHELKRDYCVVIVTHNMQQAARISDYAAFMFLGEIIEFAPIAELFTHPRKPQTEAYVTGRFG